MNSGVAKQKIPAQEKMIPAFYMNILKFWKKFQWFAVPLLTLFQVFLDIAFQWKNQQV